VRPAFFANVIAEFARSEWTAHQLEIAAMLARTMADLNREQMLLREEGAVMMTERGTPVVNLARRWCRCTHRRSCLPKVVIITRARKAVKREMLQSEIETGDPLEDYLLARPN
jgi:hypothetical protein